jgi:uncharacterized protein (DUF3084 family)/2-polyprenyl-3-methyl-5-hydroxy-6-metoxy-1,4-benzoquinol methylase
MVYENVRYKRYPLLPKTAWEKLLKHIQPKSTVLEFGCYEGEMSKILKEKYQCKVYGIEINRKAAQKAERQVDQLVVGDMEKINLANHFEVKMFDTFIFGDVLEHLIEPDGLLRRARPFLKDDGFILASLPNVGYAGIIFDLLQGEFNYSKEGLLDRSHIRFFTKDEVYYLFERTGFYVSNLDRVIIEFPQYSEFHTDLSRYSQEIVAEISRNKENLTYQFIVRAEKTSEANLIKYLKVRNRLLKMKLREATSSEKKFSEADLRERLGQKDKELWNRDQIIQERERKLNELGLELQKRDEVIGQKGKELFARDQRIQEEERRIGELSVGLEQKNAMIGEKEKGLDQRNQMIEQSEKKIEELSLELQKRDETIGEKDGMLCERGQVIQEIGQRIEELRLKLQQEDGVIRERDKELFGRDQVLQEREKTIHELETKLRERDETVGRRNSELLERGQVIQEREQRISDLTMGLQKREEVIHQKDKELSDRNQVLQERERTINEWESKFKEEGELMHRKENEIEGLRNFMKSIKWWQFWKWRKQYKT